MTKLMYAFDKYPPSEWTVNVLEVCEEAELGCREVFHIEQNDTIRDGYNLTAGGGLLNLSLSNDHKEKQSSARKIYYQTEEGKEWVSRLQERMKHDNPCKKGNVPWNTGSSLSDEHKMSISNSLKGKKRPLRDLEWSRKISEAKKGNTFFTEEHRRKLSEAGKGRPQSTKQKRIAAETFQKKWIVTSPTGEIIEVVNLNQFCRERGLAQPNLCRTGSRGWKAHKAT
jgi:DNA-binding PadR family transcriptional regulator